MIDIEELLRRAIIVGIMAALLSIGFAMLGVIYDSQPLSCLGAIIEVLAFVGVLIPLWRVLTGAAQR